MLVSNAIADSVRGEGGWPVVESTRQVLVDPNDNSQVSLTSPDPALPNRRPPKTRTRFRAASKIACQPPRRERGGPSIGSLDHPVPAAGVSDQSVGSSGGM